MTTSLTAPDRQAGAVDTTSAAGTTVAGAPTGRVRRVVSLLTLCLAMLGFCTAVGAGTASAASTPTSIRICFIDNTNNQPFNRGQQAQIWNGNGAVTFGSITAAEGNGCWTWRFWLSGTADVRFVGQTTIGSAMWLGYTGWYRLQPGVTYGTVTGYVNRVR